MNQRLTFSFVSAAFLAVAATGFVLQTGPAVAQQASEVMEVVVAEAPITARQVGQTNFGAKIELSEIKQRVSYADLDLSKYADVIELQSRVETISKESCKRLFAMYPLGSGPGSATDRRRCVKKAINSAEEQVQAAIVAAS